MLGPSYQDKTGAGRLQWRQEERFKRIFMSSFQSEPGFFNLYQNLDLADLISASVRPEIGLCLNLSHVIRPFLLPGSVTFDPDDTEH